MINKGIVVIPTHGFANRLRMLSSVYIYSNYIDKPLYICWVKEEECNIDFNTIFSDNQFNLIDLSSIKESNYHYFGKVHTMSILSKMDFIKDSEDVNYDYVILEGGHEFKHNNMYILEFLRQKNLFYKDLEFSDLIKNKVNKYTQLYDFNKIVAVHFRDIIKKYDDFDINNSELINFTKNSPIDEFYKIVSCINNNENCTNILIVSNNPEIYDKFSNKFKDKSFIKTVPSCYERNKENGIIDSVIDFILLGKTRMIIGTYYSSFSDEASFFNFIPKMTPINIENIEDISKYVNNYHCLNFSLINNIYSLNTNQKTFIEIFGEGIKNLIN